MHMCNYWRKNYKSWKTTFLVEQRTALVACCRCAATMPTLAVLQHIPIHTHTYTSVVCIFMKCYANLLCMCACGEVDVGVCQQT